MTPSHPHAFCVVSALGDAAGAEALAARLAACRPHWRVLVRTSRLVVMGACAPALACEEGAVVVGEVFVRSPSGVSRRAIARDIDTLKVDGARGALAAIWGRYAAIWDDGEAIHVLRDPSAAVRVYWSRIDGVDIAFSDGALYFDLASRAPDIDWSYLGARLVDNRVRTSRTGLKGVQALGPGHSVVFGRGLARVRHDWKASCFAALGETQGRACRRPMRREVADAAQALAQLHDDAVRVQGGDGVVAHRLSGGFDSSIVLSALVQRGPVQCLNMATATAEGDETVYAAAVADHMGATLRVARLDARAVILDQFPRARLRSPTPPLFIANGEREAAEERLLHETGATRIMSGRGGDNVFFRCLYAWPAVDLARAQGLGVETVRYVLATARRTGLSARAVWREATGRAATPLKVDGGARRGVTRRAIDGARALAPPPGEDRLAPGRAWHIALLEDRDLYADPSRACDVVHPLVAQPLLEFCLAQPSWILACGARDRGLARAALGARLPDMVRARDVKGRTSGYLGRIVWENRRLLAERLLTGRLVGAGLLDPGALRVMIAETGVGKHAHEASDLVAWLGVEIWLESVASGA